MEKSDQFYLAQDEPAKSCLLALRHLILAHNKDLTEAWKYGIPFFCYKGKMCVYLWRDKKTGYPYMGVVDGQKLNYPALEAGKRSRMKIMLFDPEKDLPV